MTEIPQRVQPTFAEASGDFLSVVTPIQPESPSESPSIVTTSVSERSLILAAAKGAIVGPFRQLGEMWGEFRQGRKDSQEIKALLAKSSQAGNSTIRERVGHGTLKAWYRGPLPVYQATDDAITFPLFLGLQHQHGPGPAYAMTAAVTFALAAAMGQGQRIAEKRRAALMQVDTIQNDPDALPQLLDSAVASAPWQVYRSAHKPRAEGKPVNIVSLSRVTQCAGAYALFNTGLYTVTNYLPGNQWAAFGLMVAGAWSVGGAYTEVKGARQNSVTKKLQLNRRQSRAERQTALPVAENTPLESI